MASAGEILYALKCATDQDPRVLKPAEEWLKAKECDGSFYITLSEICHRYDLEWTIRWMAVVCLKNGIDKYWRLGVAGSLSPENKEKIRNNMLQCLEEPTDQIAIQCAVVFAKIARFDYPSDWEGVIPFLLSGASSPRNELHQSRSLLTLKHVIKSLSAKKLPRAKEIFFGLCKTIFTNIFQYWLASHDAVKKNFQSHPRKVVTHTEQNQLLLVRIVSYMVQDYGADVISEIYKTVMKITSEVIAMVQEHEIQQKTSENGLKTATTLIKIMESLLSVSSESYHMGAQKVMSLLCDQIYGHNLTKTNGSLSEKFIVKCLNASKAVLENEQFRNVFLEGSTNTNQIAPHLETLLQCLVCQYLPLNEEDLAFWSEDAESFCNEEVGESWKFSLRPSAEVLALTLLKKFPDILVPSLLNMLRAVQALDVRNITLDSPNVDSSSRAFFKGCSSPLECVVRKEAVYYMVGLGVYEVLEKINFEDWLMNNLLPEVKSTQSFAHGKLIHRRVLWLISQWADIKPSDELRPVLYAFVVASLSRVLDTAVRLAASSTVQRLLDDFEFDINIFQSHQDSCFQGLYELLLDTENCDTKMRILNVIAYLIERLGLLVAPYAKKISDFIPPLWEHAVSENHDMLKCAIMATMVQFICALGEKSSLISHLTIPLIKESTDLNNSSHIYLLEDGLELWLAALQNSNETNEGFFLLFQNMFGLLEYGSEIVKTCFLIIEAYVLLFREVLLQQYASSLDKSFVSLATDVRNECLVLVSRVVAMMCEVSPRDASLPCIEYSKDAIKRTCNEEDSILLAANFTLSAHMVLKNTPQFLQVLQHASQGTPGNFNDAFQYYMKIWCDNIDTIVDTDKKKLSALALLTLLSFLPDIPAVASRFPDVFCAVVQVLYDVCDENRLDLLLNESDQGDSPNASDQVECPHDKRKGLLRKLSLPLTVSLPAFASETLNALRAKISEENLARLFSTVNPEIVKELQEFLRS